MKKEVKIGIIGVGLLGNIHMMSLQTIIEEELLKDKAEIQITAICDIREDHLKEYNKNYDIPNTFINYKDLIACPEVNTVYIVTPTKFHKEMFIKAAEAGHDIFCEKPVAFSPDDIQEMIEVRNKHKVIEQIGLVLRHTPLFWYVKQFIQSKEGKKLGKLQNIIFRDDQEKPYTGGGAHPSTWRKDPELAHGGTLFEHSIHDIDILMHIFGRITEVNAKVKFFAGIEPIEDSVSALFELENGASASLNSIWHNVNRDGRDLEAFFENGYINVIFKGLGTELTIHLTGEKTRKIDLKEAEKEYLRSIGLEQPLWLSGYAYEDFCFLKSIIERKPGYPNLEISLEAHKVVEECYNSSKLKKFIKIE